MEGGAVWSFISVGDRVKELLDVVDDVSQCLEDTVRTDRIRHKERTIAHDAYGSDGVLGVDVDGLGIGTQRLHQDAEMVSRFRHEVRLPLSW